MYNNNIIQNFKYFVYLVIYLAIAFCHQSIAQTPISTSNFGVKLNNKLTQATANKFSILSKDKSDILRVPPTDKKVYIDFVGTGDIQKTISEGKDIDANTGFGIIYTRFNGFYEILQGLELEGSINIFSTSDTIVGIIENNELINRRNFGSYLLNPISSRQAATFNLNAYFGYPRKREYSDNGENVEFPKTNQLKIWGNISKFISGVNIRFIASNNVWQIDNITRDLGGFYGRIGIFHEFLPDNIRVNKDEGRFKYSCIIGAHYTMRGLFGDISSDNNSEIRKRFLETDVKRFRGFEFNFAFRLNNLRAEFQAPILSAKRDNKKVEVTGLINTQFVFSIRFVGGFSLKLHENSEDR